MSTAVRSGWTVRTTSSRSTCTRSWPNYPTAPASTRLRSSTTPSTSSTGSCKRPTGGETPADPKNGWTSTSRRRSSASVRCSPSTAPRWRLSTVAMTTTWSSSRGARGPGLPTSSVRSSPRSFTTKWTCFRGSCVKEIGAGFTRCDRPITVYSALRIHWKTSIWMNWKRPESTELMDGDVWFIVELSGFFCTLMPML